MGLREIKFADDTITKNAAGAMRVAQMTTLFDGKILNLSAENGDILHRAPDGIGSITYGTNKARFVVGANEWEVLQSPRFFPYYSGKTQLVECTFLGFAPEPTVTKRMGYFSSTASSPYNTALDGFFLESDGSSNISLKAYRGGSITINKSSTNFDNGSVLSGYNWDKFGVIAFEFLWLGGAILRLWLKHPTLGWTVLHTVNWAGSNDADDVFILSPNQPIRYECRSAGVASANKFYYVCSQVATEGSTDEAGYVRSSYNTAYATNTDDIGVIYGLVSIMRDESIRSSPVKILSVGINVQEVTGLDSGTLLLLKNPNRTSGGTFNYRRHNRIIEGLPNVANTAPIYEIVAGTTEVILAVPVSSVSGNSSEHLENNFSAWLSAKINATNGSLPSTTKSGTPSDEYVLCYSPLSVNQDVAGTISYKVH